MTKNELKKIIRETVGFERQFIEIIDHTSGTFGGVTEIIFEVKGFYFKWKVLPSGNVMLAFFDVDENIEGEETGGEVEQGEESAV